MEENVYVLIEVELRHKEGIKSIMQCNAKDIDDAIEKFGWYPFEKPVTTSQEGDNRTQRFLHRGKVRRGRSWQEIEEKFGEDLPPLYEEKDGLRILDPVTKKVIPQHHGWVPVPLDDDEPITVDRVRAFYGLTGANPRGEGNGCEDQDQYVILEFGKDGVNQYGAGVAVGEVGRRTKTEEAKV